MERRKTGWFAIASSISFLSLLIRICAKQKNTVSLTRGDGSSSTNSSTRIRPFSKRTVTYSQQWQYWQWSSWWSVRKHPSRVVWTDEFQITKRLEKNNLNRINTFRTNHVFAHAEQNCIDEWPDRQEEQHESRRGQSPLFASHSASDQFWTSWVHTLLCCFYSIRGEAKHKLLMVATNQILPRVPLRLVASDWTRRSLGGDEFLFSCSSP